MRDGAPSQKLQREPSEAASRTTGGVAPSLPNIYVIRTDPVRFIVPVH